MLMTQHNDISIIRQLQPQQQQQLGPRTLLSPNEPLPPLCRCSAGVELISSFASK